jgi:peptidoglycan/xylan/chitin deacetylase (PgdA/CDA1 family)
MGGWNGSVEEACDDQGAKKRYMTSEMGLSVVLLYHRIGLPRPSSLVTGQYVAPQLLRSQLDYLTARGWQCAGLKDITEPGEDKRFAITFDDAYLSVFEHAYPALKERGMTATLFVVADQIGGANEWDHRIGDQREQLMTVDQLKMMAAGGFEIGAHTLTHAHLRDLADEELRRELSDSKSKIEYSLGLRVRSFSYPYGEYDQRVLEACKAAGYERAVTTRLEIVVGEDPFEIPRVNVRWNAFGPLLMRKIGRARRATERRQ